MLPAYSKNVTRYLTLPWNGQTAPMVAEERSKFHSDSRRKILREYIEPQ